MAGKAAAVADEREEPETHSQRSYRLTDTDRAFALKYATDGLSQVEIAKRLGKNQSSISRWLGECADTTDAAKAYFRGQALGMAVDIRRTGRAADKVKVLEGLEVLKAHNVSPIVNVLVGMPGQAVPVPQLPTIDATFASESSADTQDLHRLSVETGSDNS